VNGLSFMRIPGVPLVQPGDDLAVLISAALRAAGLKPLAGDLIAIAQKIVSKAEGRSVRLATVTPSAEAKDIAARANKDPRVVELILRESRAVIRVSPGVIIVEHRTGVVLANAGIDRSNIEDSDETALLLPEDPDASATRLRTALQREFGVPLGLVITDSIGRAWRLGTVGIAIGCAGVVALDDLRGQPDMFGRTLQVSEVAVADSIAATAVLVMGEAAEGTPLVLVRGAAAGADTDQTARDALRPAAEDLFR
jgi:coenzyme F420-0:L-glutamate ligase/coenzyme F420-1:gamma-L-glutamate ligase